MTMGKPDPRVRELFDHVRQALDILEQIMSRPATATEPQPSVGAKPTERLRPASETPDRLAYSIKEVRKVADVSRSMLYREISEGKLRAVKRGHRTLILAADLRDWIAQWPTSR
jgi:excisionase family DNA binding protein